MPPAAFIVATVSDAGVVIDGGGPSVLQVRCRQPATCLDQPTDPASHHCSNAAVNRHRAWPPLIATENRDASLTEMRV